MFIPGSMKGKHTNLVNYTHAQLLITLARIVFVDPEMAVKISARAREPLSPAFSIFKIRFCIQGSLSHILSIVFNL
jgi:hypothetical protein